MTENQKDSQQRKTNSTRRFDAVLAVIIDSLTSLFNNNTPQAAASIGITFCFPSSRCFFSSLLFSAIFWTSNMSRIS